MTFNEEEGSFLGCLEEEQRVLLILICILCLWLAADGPPPLGYILVRRNGQPEAEYVDQNEEDAGKDRNLSLLIAINNVVMVLIFVLVAGLY